MNFGLLVNRFQVFYFGVKTLNEFGHEHVYDAVEKPLLFAQTAAFLEVRSHILVSSLVISWSITEIIRYSFFGTREAFGSAPSWLLWLRYSTFLLMYPAGIISEVVLIYNALSYMKESGKYAVRMPNKWNFSFDYYYASLVGLAIYVPGKNLNTILSLKSSPRSAPSFCVLWCCQIPKSDPMYHVFSEGEAARPMLLGLPKVVLSISDPRTTFRRSGMHPSTCSKSPSNIEQDLKSVAERSKQKPHPCRLLVPIVPKVNSLGIAEKLGVLVHLVMVTDTL
ncbi:Very-long-chain (3R)-3-hydroxyacyl-CoA dehydratase PASTICCINO 2A [Capsicum annuum]|nr:Very-long-chain (3R)-3-hydroxyacyl-CoA dehydratase PASTICCINO 2A [Capsicum annuum]